MGLGFEQEPTQNFPIQSFGSLCRRWPEFKCQIMLPSNSTTRLGALGGPSGVVGMVSIEMSTPHCYSSSIPIHTKVYLAPLGHNTQRGRRQTDRAIGTGRLKSICWQSKFPVGSDSQYQCSIYIRVKKANPTNPSAPI